MSSGIVESTSAAKEKEKENQQQAQRSRLVARLLAASPDLPSFLNDLITTQAVVVAGTEAAAFIIRRGEQSGFILDVAAHVRPDGAEESVRQQALSAFKELVLPCVQQNRDGAIELAPAEGNDEGQYCLITLLRDDSGMVAVSAVVTRCRDVERAQQRLVSMQLVAGYFDLYMLKRKSEQALALASTHQDVLQFSTAVGTAENFQQSSANLCNALATRTGAVRVSLGWLKGTGIKVKALSHTEEWDKRQELIQHIERVMEEAADQDEPVYFNPTPEIGEASTQNVTREAAGFSRAQAGNSVLSVPMRKNGELVGVLTLEWAPKTALPAGAVSALTVAADVLAPQLEDRFQNDRYIVTKFGVHARKWLEHAIGPKFMVAKLVVTLLLIGVITLFVYRPYYWVVAPFQFGTTEKRLIAAPFEGYLARLGEVEGKKVRAGTTVTAGTLLAQLDTTDYVVQRQKALAEMEAALSQARSARAEGKTAAAQEADQRAAAAREQAAFYQQQIERSAIKAPFDGTVTESEATDREGGRVQAGEMLFEVARLDRLRVELSVKEKDVQMIKVGQKGAIATTSLPGEVHEFEVERIVPQGQSREGANTFTVYGKFIGEPSASWRPGMAGEAKIYTEPKSLGYIWTKSLVDWARLKWWAYKPW